MKCDVSFFVISNISSKDVLEMLDIMAAEAGLTIPGDWPAVQAVQAVQAVH